MIGISELFGHRFVVDSRKVEKGDVFVAIKGQKVDGHNFVKDAISNGAFAVLVERDVGVKNQVIVPNTVEFLGQLSKKIVEKFDPKIVAMTGSNGKTSTKEIVHTIVNSQMPAFKNEGNLNSEIGLPLSIINSYKGEPVLVLEMAQRVVGDIDYLTKLFNPDIGILLNAASAHIGITGSEESILEGKWQITTYSKDVILNFDDERIVERSKSLNNQRIFSFGLTNGNYRFLEKRFNGEKTEMLFNTPEGVMYVSVNGYWTKAMALAILIGYIVSNVLEIEFNPSVLNDYKTLSGRFFVKTLNNLYIIDDSYNASYESFKHGMEEVVSNFRRPWYAVVGGMKELGEKSKEYHEKLSTLLEQLDGVIVYDIDEDTKYINPKNTLLRSENIEEIVQYLKSISQGTIYFKASRYYELEKIISEYERSIQK